MSGTSHSGITCRSEAPDDHVVAPGFGKELLHLDVQRERVAAFADSGSPTPALQLTDPTRNLIPDLFANASTVSCLRLRSRRTPAPIAVTATLSSSSEPSTRRPAIDKRLCRNRHPGHTRTPPTSSRGRAAPAWHARRNCFTGLPDGIRPRRAESGLVNRGWTSPQHAAEATEAVHGTARSW